MAPTRQDARRFRSPMLLLLALASVASFGLMLWNHETALHGGVEGFKAWRARLSRRGWRAPTPPEPTAPPPPGPGEDEAPREGGQRAGGGRNFTNTPPAVEKPLPASTTSTGTGRADAEAPVAAGGCPASDKERVWPLYKVMEGDGAGGRHPWPGAGWSGAPLSVQDARFRSGFRFYMYNSGPFNTSAVERCYKQKMGITQDLSNIDSRIPVFKRMYVAELALWPALRAHELRTHNPDEASLFIIGFSPFLAERLKCPGIPEKWQDAVVQGLKESKHFRKKGGQDHLIFLMRFGLKLSPPLQALLDAGSLVVTTDRFFWGVMQTVPSPYKSGSVLVLPYVAPFHLDHAEEDGARPNPKDPRTHYFFAGTYQRRFGARGTLAELADHLTSVNFTDIRIPKTVAPGNGLALSSPEIVAASSAAQRRSSVCMSPQGDAITSGRLFESMAAGCVPVVVAPRESMMEELPLPSLIDWDSVALFTDNFETISKKQGGVEAAGKAIEELVGPGAGPKEQERLACMQRLCKKVFFDHLSYFNNPEGLATSMLLEAWVLLQKRGVITGPFAPPGTVGGKGPWTTWGKTQAT